MVRAAVPPSGIASCEESIESSCGWPVLVVVFLLTRSSLQVQGQRAGATGRTLSHRKPAYLARAVMVAAITCWLRPPPFSRRR
jgi:hypothetical protein